MADVTIQFHQTQWHNLSYDVHRMISLYVGPLYPDQNGVLTMTLSESRWAEIQAAMTRESKTE